MSLRKVVAAAKPLSRSIYRSQPHNEDARLKDLKQWQDFFQKPDGVPVYLKRGLTDRLIVGFIVLGTVVGSVNSFVYLYEEIIKP